VRHWIWFVVAGLIAIAGFGASAFYMVPRISHLDALMTRVVVPGNTEFALDEVGSYTVYHDRGGFVEGQYYGPELALGLKVELVDKATGTPVRLVSSTGSSYSTGDHKGTSILAFTIDHPGRYRLEATLPNGRTEPKTVLAIDRGMMWALFKLIAGTMAIGFGGLAIAGVVVGLTIWPRSKAAKTATINP
jgi:hypothetical protein